jgi:hypothetical protein
MPDQYNGITILPLAEAGGNSDANSLVQLSDMGFDPYTQDPSSILSTLDVTAGWSTSALSSLLPGLLQSMYNPYMDSSDMGVGPAAGVGPLPGELGDIANSFGDLFADPLGDNGAPMGDGLTPWVTSTIITDPYEMAFLAAGDISVGADLDNMPTSGWPVIGPAGDEFFPDVPPAWDYCSAYRDGTGAGEALYQICMNTPNGPWSNCVRGSLLNQWTPNPNPFQLGWYLGAHLYYWPTCKLDEP